MKFWGTSAITPLLVEELDSASRESLLREDADMLVWHGTQVEIESALCRRHRENTMDETGVKAKWEKLNILASCWMEIEPTIAVRSHALRLLRVHPLLAADAFQLAAALCSITGQTTGNFFLPADLRLRQAALKERFLVK